MPYIPSNPPRPDDPPFYFPDVISPYFTVPGQDLCVYKKKGNSGSPTDWADAVNKCADGSYADGDAYAGWYLPNAGELMAIYYALGGTRSPGAYNTDFADIQAPSYVATTAEPMDWINWSSSEDYAATLAVPIRFNMASHRTDKSIQTIFVRCVRRM